MVERSRMKLVTLPISMLCRPLALAAAVLALAGCAALGNRPPPPSLDEIVALSREGTAPETIIRRLQESRAVHPLTATQILALHEQGVPDPVLDWMQNAYADSIRRDERMRQDTWIWWHDCFYCYHRPVIVVPR